MKKICYSFLLVLLAHMLPAQVSHFFNCDSFCVVNIVYDTTPHFLLVTIANNDSNFINYPIVQLIDTSGDTVANAQKTFDFYGQGAHTGQTYRITTTLDSFPQNWRGKVRLEDGLFHDACIILQHCGQISNAVNELPDVLEMRLYRSPSIDELTLNFSPAIRHAGLSVTDILGRTIYHAPVEGDEKIISTATWPAGIFFVRLSQGSRSVVKRVMVQR